MIATSLVILGGVAIVLPDFIKPPEPTNVLLTFEIKDENNLPLWCLNLSEILEKHHANAAIFISGKIAKDHPECITSFDSGIDIGSQTYSYVNLNSISDYSLKLAEVQDGKDAIDITGKLDSKLFRAPYGNTDENIYSILSRSNITADFSYDEQYNKYENGKFLKFEISNYNSSQYSEKFFSKLKEANKPIIINFDNSISIEQIDSFISSINSKNIRFVSASQLTKTELTIRNGGMSY
jgi:peptidoglycan/xylan/chitin deacetylase (PgdA/CDA1 family)